ncbi:hypothetical protein [Rhizobium sp. LC145]|uniref:hypothetical protein n=1 Tax=Rhizobium sp. LC145 TaxID=1120688 RepID=UPI00062A420C|nr:hypothetical protein [Rhizobium sp. LC145]KKX33392.1 hypothetical protein YH62_07795 [Rhizobium sp. LC145]TKT58640.1 hypothetical protein FDR95_11015 [Rhizobiaceae bacterium LC148]
MDASSKQGKVPPNEVIIEITGKRKSGESGRFRYELANPDGAAAMSARGAAVAIETLLGLVGRSSKTGLFLPEMLISAITS